MAGIAEAGVRLWRADQRPDLVAAGETLIGGLFPVFLQHDAVSRRYWGQLYSERLARFQTLVEDEAGAVIAVGNAVPFRWRDDEALPDGGWDAVMAMGVEGGERPNALSALSIAVQRERRGQRIAETLLDAMKAAARRDGLKALVAPVRPTRRTDYPLQDFATYCGWQRADGEPFDPWVRAHWRLGARVEKIAPRSMTVSAAVADWETWTGLRFPENGDYWVPGGLAAVTVADGQGVYVEPNLWMRHEV